MALFNVGTDPGIRLATLECPVCKRLCPSDKQLYSQLHLHTESFRLTLGANHRLVEIHYSLYGNSGSCLRVRNPKHSAARYSLNKSVLPATLKKAFDVYDLRSAALAAGDKLSNDAVARLAGVAVEQKSVDKQAEYTENEHKRVVSATISRHYKDAKNMIENAAVGCFP